MQEDEQRLSSTNKAERNICEPTPPTATGKGLCVLDADS